LSIPGIEPGARRHGQILTDGFGRDLPSFGFTEKSGSPANKLAAFPRNFDAGSNVIDTSEPQPEKQDAPMTVTEAGR
jgi:hypothetical protein